MKEVKFLSVPNFLAHARPTAQKFGRARWTKQTDRDLDRNSIACTTRYCCSLSEVVLTKPMMQTCLTHLTFLAWAPKVVTGSRTDGILIEKLDRVSLT